MKPIESYLQTTTKMYVEVYSCMDSFGRFVTNVFETDAFGNVLSYNINYNWQQWATEEDMIKGHKETVERWKVIEGYEINYLLNKKTLEDEPFTNPEKYSHLWD